jgi:biofilm protein TabA
MILDHISRAEKYYNVHTSFRHAFDFLKQSEATGLKEGKHEIEGTDIYVILSHGKPTDPAPKLESHKKYIDIQLSMDGSFPLGWKDIDRCAHTASEYDDEKDVQTFHDTPDFKVELSKGMFAVVFPEDVHAGLPPQQHVVKAVVKVAV